MGVFAEAILLSFRRLSSSAEGKKQMIKPKRSAVQQLADELERRALHPIFVEADDIGRPSRTRIPCKLQTP